MRNLKEAKAHLNELIVKCNSDIEILEDAVGDYSSDESERAKTLLLDCRISEMSKRDWKLVLLRNEMADKARFEKSLRDSEDFVFGMQNMPADARHKVITSPAGFDPQEHAVFHVI